MTEYMPRIKIIYEKGVFNSLKKVDLKEGTRLTFIIGKKVKNFNSNGEQTLSI
jgi:predicted DNA-binding antitoxin AbrB/MazE fold protein